MTLKLIEKCPREKLNEREIYWISHYDTFHNGYNCTIGGAGTSKFWLPFEEARVRVRALGLKSNTAWRRLCANRTRHPDIPSNPNQTYKDQGWAGWGGWLGTGNVKPGSEQWRSFAEARAWARDLGMAGIRRGGALISGRPTSRPTRTLFTRTRGGSGGATGSTRATCRPTAGSGDRSRRRARGPRGSDWRGGRRGVTTSSVRPTSRPTHNAPTRTMDGWAGATGSARTT